MGRGHDGVRRFAWLALLAPAFACGAESGGSDPGTSEENGGTAGSSGASAGSSGASAGANAVAGGGAGSIGGDAGSGASNCPSDPPAPVAGGVWEGDLVIATPDDAEAATTLSEVTGSLLIAPSYPGVLDLPNLRSVGDSLELQATVDGDSQTVTWPATTELRLPNLQTIGGQLFVYLTQDLVETDFRSLETVGYRIYFMRNLGLQRIAFDSLQATDFSVQASPVLAACEIDAVCVQIGGAVGGCGAEYSDPDCTCETICGRVEPQCSASP